MCAVLTGIGASPGGLDRVEDEQRLLVEQVPAGRNVRLERCDATGVVAALRKKLDVK